MADVFISYQRQSQKVAKRVAERLTAAGYEVWWDEQIPAHRPYAEVIEERLQEARCVIVLWSEAAVRSQWVRAEADIARGQGKLVQALVEDCKPPIPFDQLQHANLKGWTGAPNHPGWRKIEESIGVLVEASLVSVSVTAPPSHGVGHTAPRRKRLPLLLGAAAAVLTLAAGGWWFLGRSLVSSEGESDANVAVQPLTTSDPALKALAASIDDQIVNVLSGAGMTPVPASMHSAAALVMEGRAQTVADKVQVTLRISTGKDHVSLWSSSFEHPAGDTAGFPDQLAGKVADIMHCGVASMARGVHLTNATRSLYLNECDLSRQMERTDEVFDLARRIEAQAPDFLAPLRGIAVAGALSLPQLPPEQAVRVRAQAAAAADRLLKADPDDAEGYLAKSLLVEPHNDWLSRERWLDRGLPHHHAAALDNNKGNLLLEVGRLSESLPFIRRGLALDPKSPPKTETLVFALLMNGDVTGAKSQFEHLMETWPKRPEVRNGGFEQEAFANPAEGLRQLEDPKTRPQGFTDAGVEAWRAFVQARASRSPAAVAHAESVLNAVLAAKGALPRAYAVRALLLLNKPEPVEAFYRQHAADGRFDASALFSPEAKAYRRDPRFMRLAHDIGLTAYWRASGKWPDFCSEPDLPYKCQDLAR